MTKPGSPLDPPEIIRRETIYEGRKVDLERLSIRTPDGREAIREVVRHPGAVVILAMTEDGRVVFERNYRIAVDDVLLELPAGTLDEGESPADCAVRELAEETGYVARSIEPLNSFHTSPGVLDEKIWSFLATDLESGQGSLDAGEQIVVELVDYDEAVAMCIDGRCRDAKTIATVLAYHFRRGQTRESR